MCCSSLLTSVFWSKALSGIFLHGENTWFLFTAQISNAWRPCGLRLANRQERATSVALERGINGAVNLARRASAVLDGKQAGKLEISVESPARGYSPFLSFFVYIYIYFFNIHMTYTYICKIQWNWEGTPGRYPLKWVPKNPLKWCQHEDKWGLILQNRV